MSDDVNVRKTAAYKLDADGNLVSVKAKTNKIEKIEPWPEDYKNFTLKQKQYHVERFKERSLSGYAGLTGRHHFYHQVCKLKTPSGKIINPLIRDYDIVCNEGFEEAKGAQEDLAIAKRRGYALTSLFGGGYSMYNAVLHPNTISLLTSADQGRLDDMYGNKVMTIYQHLPEGLADPLISKRMGKVLHLGRAKGDLVEGLNTQIICLETADGPSSPSKAEAFRAFYFFIDEAALHPYLPQTRAVSQATTSDDGFKMNPIVFGGSSGVANPRGLKSFKEEWFDPETKMTRIFVPGNYCISNAPVYDEKGDIIPGKSQSFMYEKNGIYYSDHKRARQWIEATRLKKFKKRDKTDYYQFVKAYCLYESEYFDSNVQNAFSEDIQSKIIESSARIMNEPPSWVKYYVFERNGKVQADVDQIHGFVDVLEIPKPGVDYGFGTDPIPWGDNMAEVEKGSMVAMVGSELARPLPIVHMATKSMNSDLVVSQMTLVQRWYNNGKNMIERNRGGVMISKYIEAGLQFLMCHQPTWFGPSYIDKKHRYGYYYGTGTMEKVEDQLVQWINEYIVMSDMTELIEDLKMYGKAYNTDRADAWKAFLVQHKQYLFDIEMLRRDRPDEYNEVLVTKLVNGVPVLVPVAMKISPEEQRQKALSRMRGDYIDTRGEQDDFDFLQTPYEG